MYFSVSEMKILYLNVLDKVNRWNCTPSMYVHAFSTAGSLPSLRCAMKVTLLTSASVIFLVVYLRPCIKILGQCLKIDE